VNGNHDESLDPERAASRIRQARGTVRRGKRWHAGTLLALGIATAAYFALVGLISRDSQGIVLMLVLLLLPLGILRMLMSVREARPPAESRAMLRFESALAGVYIVLLAVAVLLDAFVLEHGTLAAALVGLLPALPCIYGAWQISRR
jgi:hypothetical protein